MLQFFTLFDCRGVISTSRRFHSVQNPKWNTAKIAPQNGYLSLLWQTSHFSDFVTFLGLSLIRPTPSTVRMKIGTIGKLTVVVLLCLLASLVILFDGGVWSVAAVLKEPTLLIE